MREEITNFILDFVKGAPYLREPLVGFADCRSPMFPDLKNVVMPGHLMPEDILSDPKIIISYFLPFQKEVALSNVSGRYASKRWTECYVETNRLIASLNAALIDYLKDRGFRAAYSENAVHLDNQTLMSCWSQRHIAEIAGLGKFGLNNLLITRVGSCGRFGSLVTDLPITPDVPETEERCLYKLNGGCMKCVKNCPTGALTEDKFDRWVCFSLCQENEMRYGENDCGKCAVDIPCGFLGE